MSDDDRKTILSDLREIREATILLIADNKRLRARNTMLLTALAAGADYAISHGLSHVESPTLVSREHVQAELLPAAQCEQRPP